MTLHATTLLVALQLFQVLFLALHDWIPLASLNDIKAVQAADSRARLLTVTAISTAPYAFGLAACLYYGARWPTWLLVWLWVSYALLFLGQLRAWWIPYLFRAEPARAARYQKMFGNTHAFLPMHNGIRPNTLHILLHLSTLATLVMLGVGTG